MKIVLIYTFIVTYSWRIRIQNSGDQPLGSSRKPRRTCKLSSWDLSTESELKKKSEMLEYIWGVVFLPSMRRCSICIYLVIKGCNVVILERQMPCKQHKQGYPARPKVCKGTIIAFVINNLHNRQQFVLGKLISGKNKKMWSCKNTHYLWSNIVRCSTCSMQ